MTVKMTMEEYKELEAKAEKFNKIVEAIKDLNKFPEDKERYMRGFFELMNKLGLRVPNYI